MTSRTTPMAAATSATPSADQKESTEMSPFVRLSAASSVRASTTSTSTNPTSSISGKWSAATSGGSSAFRIAITRAATSAPLKLDVEAPGTIQAASSSAAAERTHVIRKASGWKRGRAGVHAGCCPYESVLLSVAVMSQPDGIVLGNGRASVIPTGRSGSGGAALGGQAARAEQALADVAAGRGDLSELPQEHHQGHVRARLGAEGADAAGAERHHCHEQLPHQLVGRLLQRGAFDGEETV